MPQVDPVLGHQLVDGERDLPQVPDVMVDADGQPRLLRADDAAGPAERLRFGPSMSILMNEIGSSPSTSSSGTTCPVASPSPTVLCDLPTLYVISRSSSQRPTLWMAIRSAHGSCRTVSCRAREVGLVDLEAGDAVELRPAVRSTRSRHRVAVERADVDERLVVGQLDDVGREVLIGSHTSSMTPGSSAATQDPFQDGVEDLSGAIVRQQAVAPPPVRPRSVGRHAKRGTPRSRGRTCR